MFVGVLCVASYLEGDFAIMALIVLVYLTSL